MKKIKKYSRLRSTCQQQAGGLITLHGLKTVRGHKKVSNWPKTKSDSGSTSAAMIQQPKPAASFSSVSTWCPKDF